MKLYFMSTNFKSVSFRVATCILFYFWCLPSFGQDLTLLNNNKKIISRYFDVVVNAHDLNRKGEFFQSDYIWHTMDGKDVHSNEDSGHNTILRWLFTAIPDVQYTIVHILSQGDMVAVFATATGTARSEMFGLPAAQKKVHYQQMFFYRLRDGKITEQWEALDPGVLKSQLEAK
jgi:predicted ester cyclase